MSLVFATFLAYFQANQPSQPIKTNGPATTIIQMRMSARKPRMDMETDRARFQGAARIPTCDMERWQTGCCGTQLHSDIRIFPPGIAIGGLDWFAGKGSFDQAAQTK